MGENSRCAMLLVFTPTTLAGDGVAGASREGLAGKIISESGGYLLILCQNCLENIDQI